MLKKPKKFSNKFLKATNKKSLKVIKVYKFLNPYPNYRIYGDLVFTDKLLNPSNETIYTYELVVRDYKKVRQIFVRSKGVILELEDFDENLISSLDFIRSRLVSLGDKTAFEFSELLHSYKEFFMKKQENISKKISIKKNISEKCEALLWIDDLFEKNKENVVFIRGSKLIHNNDCRTIYLGFNDNLLEWITDETNYFSEQFISDCLKIFCMKNMEEFINIMKVKMGKCFNISNKIFNTLVGAIKFEVEVKFFMVLEEKVFFHYIIIKKNDFDKKFLDELKKYKDRNTKNRQLLKGRSETINYIEMMKMYYLNRDLK